MKRDNDDNNIDSDFEDMRRPPDDGYDDAHAYGSDDHGSEEGFENEEGEEELSSEKIGEPLPSSEQPKNKKKSSFYLKVVAGIAVAAGAGVLAWPTVSDTFGLSAPPPTMAKTERQAVTPPRPQSPQAIQTGVISAPVTIDSIRDTEIRKPVQDQSGGLLGQKSDIAPVSPSVPGAMSGIALAPATLPTDMEKKVNDVDANVSSMKSVLFDRTERLDRDIRESGAQIASAKSDIMKINRQVSDLEKRVASIETSGVNLTMEKSTPVLSGFRLQGISDGRVLIGGPSGVVAKKIGEMLEGAGTIKSVMMDETGKWVVTTDRGQIRP